MIHTSGDLVPCPEADCDMPAEVTRDWCERSDPGPFTHVYATRCPSGHWFHGLPDN